MKTKENLYKGRVFSIGSPIGEGRIPHRVDILESYGDYCLGKTEKAYLSGPFVEYNIYKLTLMGDGTETIFLAGIDYSQGTEPFRGVAPEAEVRSKWSDLISRWKVVDFERGIVEDRKKREAEAMAEAEKLKSINREYLKTRIPELQAEIRGKVASCQVEKLLSDKTFTGLLTEWSQLEMIKTIKL